MKDYKLIRMEERKEGGEKLDRWRVFLGRGNSIWGGQGGG